MTTYLELFLALKHPQFAHHTATFQTREDWKQFFGMMERLEHAQIAVFYKGRYELHPKHVGKLNAIDKEDLREEALGEIRSYLGLPSPVEQAEAVLAEISKPLTLDLPDEIGGENDWGRWEQLESLDAPVVTPAPIMPQFNICPACKGKGRVNIEDVMGYFGSFLCMTCMGKKQIPVPSRDTFPPVDLSKKPESPNSVLFSDTPNPVAAIPQALEVGGVRVIVEAPAPVLSVIAEELSSETLVGIVKKPIVPADCLKCQGSGIILDHSDGLNLRVQTCPECGGDGTDDPSLKYPYGWEIASEEELAAAAIANPADALKVKISSSGESSAPVVKASACSKCGSTDMCHEIGTEPSCDLCIDCCRDKNGPAWVIEEDAEAINTDTSKQYVHINTTGRGMSSGKYEVVRQEEKYGRQWMVVKFTTADGLPHHFPAELCELVTAPQPAPTAVEVVSAPKPNLLEGLPIMQAIATHGLEETKAALNVVKDRVVAEVLSADKLLVTEGQGVS